ncbi:MAG TPA: hypothetical protein VG873_05330 [Burkholderiales bacterium]|nr:hypothetical protein [Burkholderiales bacterium]
MASKNVLAIPDQAGPETSFPKRPAPFIPAIEVGGVALPDAMHESRTRPLAFRRQQQVNVVRHQAVRVDRAFRFRRQASQQRQIDEIVGFRLEAGSAVVSALNDVQRMVRKH